jgi:Ni/Co efflux regulator RcnB
MSIRSMVVTFTRLAIASVLMASVGVAVAQDHGNPHDDGYHGNPHDNGSHGNPHDKGRDFHFRDQDRGQFESHYSKDISRWRGNPHRPRFVRGQRVPASYRFQPVPRAYYANVPPPPVGYQYGYYDGYVVAYNPTSRIIADVLDLAAAATR